jgi:hypothetical protein
METKRIFNNIQQDYNPYADYFLNRRIRRINEVSVRTEVRFDLKTNRETKAPA